MLYLVWKLLIWISDARNQKHKKAPEELLYADIS